MIGQAARLFHRPYEPLDDLFRYAAMTTQLCRLLAHLTEQALKRRLIRIQRTLVLQQSDVRLQVARLSRTVVERRRTLLALEQEL